MATVEKVEGVGAQDDQPQLSDEDALEIYLECFGPARDRHAENCEVFNRRWDAYLSRKPRSRNQQPEWQSDLHPRFIGSIVEQIFAMLAGEAPETRIKPSNPTSEAAARHVTRLLAKHRSDDEHVPKWRRAIHQALIMNVCPIKTYWPHERRAVRSPYFEPSEHGYMQGPLKRKWRTDIVNISNRPSIEVVDVFDFMWDPAAATWDKVTHGFHRVRVTPRHLKERAKAGWYHNTDEISQQGTEVMTDERAGTFTNRPVGKYIELWEYWAHDRLITVAPGNVVIRNEPNPFTHGDIPFVMMQTYDDLYAIGELSIIDFALELQEAMTSILNQSIDNAKFLNNAVIFYRNTMLDRKKLLKWHPGALIPVDDPAEVVPFTPSHNMLNAAQAQMDQLERMMQGMTGAVSVLSGASSESLDPNTATQINVMQSMAQLRVQLMRENLNAAGAQIDRHQVGLMKQLQQGPVALAIDETAGVYQWEAIDAHQIMGEFEFTYARASESINKQTERAEATQKLQTLAELAGVMAANPMGKQINLEPALVDYLRAYGIDQVDKYLTEPAPMPLQLPPPPAEPGGGQVV